MILLMLEMGAPSESRILLHDVDEKSDTDAKSGAFSNLAPPGSTQAGYVIICRASPLHMQRSNTDLMPEHVHAEVE